MSPTELESGTRGGSHVANSEVLKILQEKLGGLLRHGKLKVGELAALIESFEREKKDLDYDTAIRNDELVILHGLGTRTLSIEAWRLQRIFSLAFSAGYRALMTQIKSLHSLGKDFGILLTGGSFGNPALRRRVEMLIQKLTANCSVKIEYEFLADSEAHP